VPGPAAAHEEAEPAAAPGGPRAAARRAVAEARALAVREHLADAGHLGGPGLGHGSLGRAPAAAGLGFLGEHGRRVLVPPHGPAQLPRQPDDGRRRRLQVTREPLRGPAGDGAGVVLEDGLGVGVLLERVVAVVHAVDLRPRDVVAQAQLHRLRRVAADVVPRGGHGARGERERERERGAHAMDGGAWSFAAWHQFPFSGVWRGF